MDLTSPRAKSDPVFTCLKIFDGFPLQLIESASSVRLTELVLAPPILPFLTGPRSALTYQAQQPWLPWCVQTGQALSCAGPSDLLSLLAASEWLTPSNPSDLSSDTSFSRRPFLTNFFRVIPSHPYYPLLCQPVTCTSEHLPCSEAMVWVYLSPCLLCYQST